MQDTEDMAEEYSEKPKMNLLQLPTHEESSRKDANRLS